MKMKILLAVAAIFALSLFTDSFAQMERMKMREKMRDRIEEKLNLTDSQKAKIEEMRVNHQKKMIDLNANLEKKKVELRALRNSEKLNRSDLVKLTKEISEIKNSMAIEKANHHMDIYEILDNNQKQIWREMKPGHRMRDGKGFGFHKNFDKD